MEVKLLSNEMDELLPMDNRTLGSGIVHVSECIHLMCIRMGIYDPQSQVNMSMLQLGCALEHAIAHRYCLDDPDKYVQPGEQYQDGLYYTPDLWEWDVNVLHEIKLTWMSSRHDPTKDKFWRYRTQLASYCYGFGTCTGILHVAHVRGDYRNTMVDYNKWKYTWTERELKENWRVVQSYRHEVLRERGTN